MSKKFLSNVRIGIAPIGWTNDDFPELGGDISFEQCLDEMVEAGYEGCEIGSQFPKDVNHLKRALTARKLEACNQWYSFTLTTRTLKENITGFRRQIEFLRELGCGVIGGGEVGSSTYGDSSALLFSGSPTIRNTRAWKTYCQHLEECGRIAHDEGMKLAFHPHMGTVIESLLDIEKLLNDTHPDYLHINYDSGHLALAGEDPVQVLNQIVDRVAHVHLKDVRPFVREKARVEGLSFMQAIKAGIFTVPGDRVGMVDFPSIFKVLKKNNYSGWLVVEAEQDPASANPFEYAKLARKYIEQETGL